MEPRRLLGADVPSIYLGAVYYEDDDGEDQGVDQIEITWTGGAPGTTLTQLVIETDKDAGSDYSPGDVFFDTAPGGMGVYGSAPLTIVDQTGIDRVDATVADGGMRLVISFVGFDAGEKLVFTIDVDEWGDDLGGTLPPEEATSAVAEGSEFQGSRLRATFVADHYLDAGGSDFFVDRYETKLSGSGLDLPPDNYVPPGDTPHEVRTAGAILSLEQTPLPITIAGTVFEDAELDNQQDPGDPGLAGVRLALYLWEDGRYVAIGKAVTDSQGNYRFVELLPGTYQIAESQPDGYLSVGASAGRVEGQTRGEVVTRDVIGGIDLLGGDESTDNDFSETRPVSLSGHVYHDANNDGVMDPGEEGIAGVLVRVPDRSNPPGVPLPSDPIEVYTDQNGYWAVTGLYPDEYWVEEVQPQGYLDGLDAAGTAGGVAQNPGDRIDGFRLDGGDSGEEYNFGELRPASISGRVHAELDRDCIPDPGEPLLGGVTVYLLDKWGNHINSTTTDENGRYFFGNLEPGTYGVEEVQPPEYYDGQDHVGSAGGILDGNDRIVGAKLTPGAEAMKYNFCEVVPASISGYVFQDGPTINVGPFEEPPDPADVRDGIFTPDDKPIPGVTLRLGDATGEPVLNAHGRPRIAVTDARGYYEFTFLEPGIYTILEVQPDGYVDGIDSAGSEGGVPVNPREVVDPIALGRLTVDPNNDAILSIWLSPGDEAVWYNFSEVAVEKLPFILPPPPAPSPPPTPVPPSPLPPSPARVASAQARPARHITLLPMYGGYGIEVLAAYTWHLSVVNAGRPRRDGQGEPKAATEASPEFNTASWKETELDRSQWVCVDEQGRPVVQFQFGTEGGIPVSGDFDGDGIWEVAVFVGGVWYIDLNGNGVWDERDLWVRLGEEGDLPVTGDWDGDGKTDIGIFGPAWKGDTRAIAAEPGLPDSDNHRTGPYKNIPPDPHHATVGVRIMRRTIQGDLRADLIDHVFQYGRAGDVPIAGDWNGDGVSNIGLFRGGNWYLDADGNGRWSTGDMHVENFGSPGDVPVVGDWDGDGVDDLGVYHSGRWRLDSDGDRRLTAHDRIFELGTAADQPVVGDFNGDGLDQIGIYRESVVQPQGQAFRPADELPGNVAARY